MRLFTLALTAAAVIVPTAHAQDRTPAAGMLRYPDVSKDNIVFVYANDLWLVPREGGMATPLASPAGQEFYPRFSPDGDHVVFQGNYEGDRDLYTIPLTGGAPERLTHHPGNETPTDWTDDGIVYHMSGTAGLGRQQQIFTVSPEGGMPEKLPPAYGANGAMSPDGEWLAYTPNQRDFRTWKRYRGGMASDIWIMNLRTLESRKITDHEGTDTLPMWHGDTVYYLSDAGPEHKLNIWSYDVSSRDREQVTDFDEYDVKFPSMGPGDGRRGEIVCQNGSNLYLVNLRNGRARAVEVTIPGAKPNIREKLVDASENVMAGAISATGKRAVIEARGDIWTIPAESGAPRQLTDTSGAAERSPAWSPDGRWVSYFSDESGEYNLYVTQSDGKGETKQLTDLEGNYFFQTHWAPNSESLLITDKTGAIHHINVETGERTQIAKDAWANQPSISWSGDSRWIAYNLMEEDSGVSVIHIHDTDTGETRAVTSGFFNDTEPVFAKTGEYLYYSSNRDFSTPSYEDVGTTFVYGRTERLMAVPLNSEVENATLIEPDEETWDDEEEEDEEAGEDEEGEEGEDGDDEEEAESDPIQGTWSATATGLAALGLPSDELTITIYIKKLEDGTYVGASESQGEVSDYDSVEFDPDTGELILKSSQGPINSTSTYTVQGEKMTGTWEITGAFEGSGNVTAERTSEEVPDDKIDESKSGASDDPVEIDFEGFEARGVLLPVGAGSFNNLLANDSGAVLYNSFSPGAPPSIKLIDAADDDPEEKNVATGAQLIDVSGDGKKILIAGQAGWKIVDAKAGQSLDGASTPDDLLKRVNPREEWEQVFTDAWRRHRDFFYVENMHGVDWDDVYERYHAMLDDAVSREDVSFVIAEMISELNVGHAYYNPGGTNERQPSQNVGLLAADYELAEEGGETAYAISKLYHGAPWDADARNPLMAHGMDVEVGDFITHVNGARIDTDQDIWAAFVGTAGEETTITIADALTGDDETRNVREYTIEPIGSEFYHRYRDWVESKRQIVDEASDGRIGYIYVINTGIQGQNELFRQFYGQIGKDALIIDDRWNGGGQIPTRFIELLNRPRTNYWYRRDGKDWGWPPDSHQGPKAMLINGSAGSGGDMFPWLFRHNDLGKLIGQRTWGGLVGITGMPPLIDGASTSVPNFGFYETDGTWGVEGHGVDPDIEVVDDPTDLAKGVDTQLNAAIEHLLEELETGAYEPPRRPSPPDRSGFGITDDDK